MYKNVIVKRPCRAMVGGITSAPELGRPDYTLALKQHDDYIEALKACGVRVSILPAEESFPDSCFVEDTAVLTEKCAIITNPGAPSRKMEILEIIPAIKEFYRSDQIEYIMAPGTLEGGDVMRIGDHFYVGRSSRTNEEGIKQFFEILDKHGYTGSEITLKKLLHLKAGINYIENNNVLVRGEFIHKSDFGKFNKLIVPEEEAYGANCIWINGTVIVPKGCPTVLESIEKEGYKTIVVDTSEYKKIDGGLSCLSLRF